MQNKKQKTEADDLILGEGRTKHAAILSNCEVLGSDEGRSSFNFFRNLFNLFNFVRISKESIKHYSKTLIGIEHKPSQFTV